MTDDIALTIVVLTVLSVHLSRHVEIKLFKRAIELAEEEAPDSETMLRNGALFMLTKYICNLETVPEPKLVLCEQGKQRDSLLDALNVPGVVSCRPFDKETDSHYALFVAKATI